jgi:hypothetical protein
MTTELQTLESLGTLHKNLLNVGFTYYQPNKYKHLKLPSYTFSVEVIDGIFHVSSKRLSQTVTMEFGNDSQAFLYLSLVSKTLMGLSHFGDHPVAIQSITTVLKLLQY